MKKSIRIATSLLALLAAAPALATDLKISPAAVSMSLASGENGSTSVVGSVNNPPLQPYSIAVQLRPFGGTLPAFWLTSQQVNLTNKSTQVSLPLSVRVPASAAPGVYTAFIKPQVLASSIPVSPSAPLTLSVTVTSRCAAAPTLALAVPQPSEFKAPNGRLADVAFAGTLSLPAGCTLGRAWYTLADEYGVLNQTGEVVVATDGSLGFTVPVQVSRRGDDRDGRLYQVTVSATDEAGTGTSAPASVVVRHDQRKGE